MCNNGSPSSDSIESSPPTIGKMMLGKPTTVRVVQSMKPFLLGIGVGIVLICFTILSSIHISCSHHSPIDVNSSTRIPVCQSPQTLVPELETQNTFDLGDSNSRRLSWKEAVPFFSLHKKKKERKQKEEQLSTDTSDQENTTPPRVDFLSCLCPLVRNPLGNYNGSKYSHDNEMKTPLPEQSYEHRHLASEKFPTAFTPVIQNLSPKQEAAVKKLGDNVLESVSDFGLRSSLVPWGGPPQKATAVSFDWYAPKIVTRSLSAPLDQIDGGNLLASYLTIMKWPEDLSETDFPFKLCKERVKNKGNGCDTTVAFRHTLEFRERYKPWLVTHGMKRANANGLVYTRGFSPPYSENDEFGHSIVWINLGRKLQTVDKSDKTEQIFFARSMIREFDRAVAVSLQRSNGRLGKFNAVIDGEGFTWGSMPSLHAVKNLVSILQDHFAGRLGVILLVNSGTICELLLKLFLPLISEEVRNKIVILPRDKEESIETMEIILGSRKAIPIGLGGFDDYVFNPDEYYADDRIGEDEEALEYLVTMPYHA